MAEVDWKKYVDMRFCELQKRIDITFNSHEKALILAAQEEVDKRIARQRSNLIVVGFVIAMVAGILGGIVGHILK